MIRRAGAVLFADTVTPVTSISTVHFSATLLNLASCFRLMQLSRIPTNSANVLNAVGAVGVAPRI